MSPRIPVAAPFSSRRLTVAERGIEELRKHGPEPWVYIGTHPTDLFTTFYSPPWQNSWTHALGTYDRVAFRWDEHYRLEFKGHATGGASGTVAFTLPANWRPDKDLSFLTDVVTGGVPKAAQIFVTALTGAVKITLL